ncbi:beta-lactamase/transpeptidase-like protein [Aspergillus pseudonomiae]|uniref:Beta-lactamase/transpeptidase-like protein n=1 Tax=Aspergillus pseudonomiae TaxID=1506151 RepID=A0A5N6HYU6_9EURO|nr:beta-lactamase/transpeptidase-like protein [Aspergillus pseudonomiae]KAB8258590.1 beta-lactamase/transpeptidase-like protein [Aspergillus pseudonomiae]KAE8402531.1 beta-lactamase/transpeptidase-like protein [Aspergillus pseudonomiae]
MAQVDGTCDPAFSAVRDILQQNISSDKELGASICVSVKGKTVVDIWGGYADIARSKPWSENTIVSVWSMTKTVMNLAMLLLIDRGMVDPDAPVINYWPEFGVNGKEGVLVRHFMSHTAGLPSFDPPIDEATLFNVPQATENLVQQKPWWTPGTAHGYHLTSQGHLIGELVHRVTGKTLGDFIHDELAVPRNADFHLPVAEEEWDRIAEMVPGTKAMDLSMLDPNSITYRAMTGNPANQNAPKEPAFRRSGIGSMAGFTNARGANDILSIITQNGTVDGKRFLSPETIAKIFEVQASGQDLVIGLNIEWGLGFGIGAQGTINWLPSGKVAFWGGWGGSFALMDLDRQMTFTYAMNKMGMSILGNERTGDYVRAAYAALDGYNA